MVEPPTSNPLAKEVRRWAGPGAFGVFVPVRQSELLKIAEALERAAPETTPRCPHHDRVLECAECVGYVDGLAADAAAPLTRQQVHLAMMEGIDAATKAWNKAWKPEQSFGGPAMTLNHRADFERWLRDVHMLDATWDEPRNCYKEFPAHLAFQAWQAARAASETPVPSSKPGVVEAMRDIQALADYAYAQGFHELGYDPVALVANALLPDDAPDDVTDKHEHHWLVDMARAAYVCRCGAAIDYNHNPLPADPVPASTSKSQQKRLHAQCAHQGTYPLDGKMHCVACGAVVEPDPLAGIPTSPREGSL